jgi:NAD(P)H-hydrate repair Nnr-like enzyme with NAD(P)H-hydrate dehydratase domain
MKNLNLKKINPLNLKNKLVRSAESHKGDFGHVLVIGGNIGLWRSGFVSLQSSA